MLLFVRLGHYALWDDEAVTALAAEGVWRTGDTSVVLDHNVVAYRGGLLLKGTHERSTPPLGAYIASPFVGFFGESTFAVRFPFACFGLASVAMILFWLHTLRAGWLTWLLVGMGLIGNVSLWLYCRQCRYYSPAIFSTIVIAYLYLNYSGKRWQLVLLAIASLMLLAANYLNYLALSVCMLLDYAIIGRKRWWLGLKDWLIILLPQIILGAFIVLTWNTLGTGNKAYLEGNSLANRFKLVWMNLRDINNAEYGVGLLFVIAVVLFCFLRKQSWLLRGPLILVAYVTVVSMLSPQVLDATTVFADIRYLAPVIPLCIAIGVLVAREAARIHPVVAVVLGVIAFGSNLLNGQWLDGNETPRSTLYSFLGELSDPPAEPYTPTIDWVNANVAPMQSIWVLPEYMTYPLMFAAPKPVYAWQFDKELPPAFKNLPPIHLKNREMPQYIIMFAPGPHQVAQVAPGMSININNQRYDVQATLPVFGQDTYRPELFWHRFTGVPMTQELINSGCAVYVFHQVTGPSIRLDGRP